MKRTFDRMQQTSSNETSPDMQSEQVELSGHTQTSSSTMESIDEAWRTEERVGIAAFVNPDVSGFSAILKQRWVHGDSGTGLEGRFRFTDFIVNEIDMQGQVVRLTSQEVPESGTKEQVASISDTEALQTLERFSGSVCRQAIEEALSADTIKGWSFTTEPIEDKQQRTALHQLLKSNFEQKFDSETAPNQGIRIFKRAKKPSYRDRVKLPGKFCQFVLVKENKDTFDAIQTVARILHLNPKCFSYAGTKDRRGVTTQNMTAQRVHAEKLASFSSEQIQLGNFTYVDRPLRLGDLNGNRFTITLRNVQDAMKEEVQQRLESLQRHGFVNYFGMQRFGNSSSAATHVVGIQILRGQWKEAVDLLLDPRCSEIQDSQRMQSESEARKAWKEGDLKSALQRFPRSCTAERAIVEYFFLNQSDSPRNYSNAIGQIPRNLRLMYVHAYQSYIWNKVATERIQRYGLQPILGDLIMQGDSEQVQVIETEEQLKQASSEDIVLPMPGHGSMYPCNAVGELFHELMRQDGLDEVVHARKIGDYALKGAYRKLFGQAKDLEWKFVRYNDVTVQLASSELFKMGEDFAKSVADAQYLALILSFNLDTSQYATMALRELMKMPTLSQFQRTLNVE